ncbi:MAG TPA: MerR family transcriptional regulator [Bacillus sp. (in: firmicutes)]|nr:MerR family transcriptional regulator [Bacillus sp. (in: firmicutes)]
MKGLTRSEIAKASKVNIETIRYYERRGLISEPPRNNAGYRMYPQEVIKDIEFIKRAQDLGFTVFVNIKLSQSDHFKSEPLNKF